MEYSVYSDMDNTSYPVNLCKSAGYYYHGVCINSSIAHDALCMPNYCRKRFQVGLSDTSMLIPSPRIIESDLQANQNIRMETALLDSGTLT